jgi:hypothetical protein
MICRSEGENMQTSNNYNSLPETGLVRLSQILGDKKKGIPPIIPVSKSTWWAGVKSGRYPKPIKLGERTTCWNVIDIRKLINPSDA